MSISFVGVGNLVNFTNQTTIQIPIAAGTSVGDLILIAVAVQNAAPGSAPLVDADLVGGWTRVASVRPASTGSGIEVWGAHYGSGTTTDLALHGSYTGISGEICYTCASGQFGVVADLNNAQVTGDNPVWPSVTAPTSSSVFLAIGADTLSGVGFAFPAGWNTRRDNAYNGVFGNVELVMKDITVSSSGPYGTVTTTATVSPAGADGGVISLMLDCSPYPTIRGGSGLPLLGVG